tara:strand:+ start:7 stop:1176 length:1170 start_codon:yes stop_codon:yes gene_type:complete
MCSPTRHNIYTGLYPVRSGAYPNHTFAKAGTQSIVHYLKPLGYRVALSGKTHIAPKEVFPFEYSGLGNNPDMAKIDTLMAECVAENVPFCLFACSNEPHTPWNKGDAGRYPPEEIVLPPYLVDTPETRDGYSRYLAEITYYDEQVGQILKLLEKNGLVDNTLVMVTSEQGNGMPFAKWTLYDSGLQSALIARWPGRIAEGSLTDAMVEYVDVTPTLVDAAGGEPAPGLDGKSFLPVMLGDSKEHKSHVFGIMTTRGVINHPGHYGIRSVRSRQFKLIQNLTPEVEFTNACTKSPEFLSWVLKADAGDEDAKEKVRRYQRRPAFELFDVSKDPLEWTNLAADPEYGPVMEELKVTLAAWMKSQGDMGQETEMAAYEHQKRGKKSKKDGKK